MSFFGFNTALPSDSRGRGQELGHNTAAPGFGQPQDAFAGLSGKSFDDGEALDFEDTYDGLGDQLEESGDAFNDDTFGDGPATQEVVGKDFDFSGQTSRVADAIREEQMRFQAARPTKTAAAESKKPAKPIPTGYEGYIPQLEASASIWGLPAKKTLEPPVYERQQGHDAPRKMMTVEEIEAAMLAESQSRKHESSQQPTAPVQPVPQVLQQQIPQQAVQIAQYQQHPPTISPQPPAHGEQPHIIHHSQQYVVQQHHPISARVPVQLMLPEARNINMQQPQQVWQGQHPRTHQMQHVNQGYGRQDRAGPSSTGQQPRVQPRQILQNPNRAAGRGMQMAPPSQPLHGAPHAPQTAGAHRRGPSYQGPIITSPQQILQLSEEDRAAFLMEEAKRAKRNHKIATMAKGNGFMTPQDKNFVSRLQLTQLMSAAGSLGDPSPEARLNDDFYYQVHTQIFGAPRENPHQPASQFAQTYLFQTGNRYGGGRRYHRGGDNHIQRMEQQVQRAVEAARAKQKPKDLNFAGSLGKITFSNSKTPRPLLNVKQTEGNPQASQTVRRPSQPHDPAAERRETLRSIEAIFSSLMRMEDHERRKSPLPNAEPDSDAVQRHMEWREELQSLNAQLWRDLKVMEPVIEGQVTAGCSTGTHANRTYSSSTVHPFIRILSFAKGKKLIPRVWRHLDDNQRLTMLTLIVVNLDSVDVIAKAIPPHDNPDAPLSASIKEEVEVFASSVMPTLFALVNELQMHYISGLLSLILDRSTVQNVVRTKIGTMLLTMLLSHAEVLKETAQAQSGEAEHYTQLFTRLFDLTEPALPYLFTPASTSSASIHDADDFHVWRFLAAMGAASGSDQQQRLVIGVKDRVMETVTVSKALPPELKESRLGNVNLFMTAIGLDVSLLQ